MGWEYLDEQHWGNASEVSIDDGTVKEEEEEGDEEEGREREGGREIDLLPKRVNSL